VLEGKQFDVDDEQLVLTKADRRRSLLLQTIDESLPGIVDVVVLPKSTPVRPVRRLFDRPLAHLSTCHRCDHIYNVVVYLRRWDQMCNVLVRHQRC